MGPGPDHGNGTPDGASALAMVGRRGRVARTGTGRATAADTGRRIAELRTRLT